MKSCGLNLASRFSWFWVFMVTDKNVNNKEFGLGGNQQKKMVKKKKKSQLLSIGLPRLPHVA
jgi:hypothetical protein